MKRYIKFLLFCGCLSIVLSSCELFGLDYQYDYENEKSPVNLYLDVNCYEFIQEHSHSNMALMFEAINRAGMKDFYESEDRTFLLLEDDQFAELLKSYMYASVSDVPVDVLKDILCSYTLKGLYTAYDLTTSPIDVDTFNEYYQVRIHLYATKPGSSQDITSIRAGWTPKEGEEYVQSGFYTTNLRPTNGVAHLLKERLKVKKIKK